jgi:TonB-linked SusC/RagA family outer membrane protein
MKKITDLSVLKKLSRIMKLTTFLILISVVCVFAGNSYSQSKKINLSIKSATVKEVLSAIEDQSEFKFMYSGEVIDVNREVTLSLENVKIEDALKSLFAGTEVNYAIKDRIIVLTTPEIAEGNPAAQQQKKTISGKVTDSSGATLPGVSVVVKGTTTGVITDIDGKYSLSNVPENGTLQFSFVGMKSQEVVVGSKTTIDVKFIEETVGIEEVVAIGYGTMKKSDLTGAVTKVKMEQLNQLPNVSVIQSMQGTVAGLNIGAVDAAGENPAISIRGNNTLSGSAGSPLIVLDGVIYRGSIIDLNTADIESVDILKDASSAAIYGSQASNGVMIITTKKGIDLGKPIINYSGSYTIQAPSNSLEPMKGKELASFLSDVFWDSGSRIAPDYLKSNPNFSFLPFMRNAEISNNYQQGIENDWWGLLTGNGHINNQNISIRGKNQTIGYFISGGLSDVKGFIENDHYKKYNYRINVDAKINDWMSVGIESFLTSSDYSGVSPGVSASFVMYPWAPIYDASGNYFLEPMNNGLNPFLQMQIADSQKKINLGATFHADIKIPYFKGMNYRINYSQNLRTNNNDQFNPWGANYNGTGYKNSDKTLDWTLDNILTYQKTFKNIHKVNMTLVYGVEKINYSFTNTLAKNFKNKELGYNSLQAGDPSLFSLSTGAEQETSEYSMGRLFYSFRDKYLVTTTVRRDGFSGFGSNRKFGVFPSMALGWVMTEEGFLKGKINWVNLIKLRGSYGVSGRRAVSRYGTNAIVSMQPSVVFGDGGSVTQGEWISKMANNDLGWETTTGLNFGLDFGFLNSRLNGSIEYYSNDTKNILYAIQLPVMTGFQSISTNIGKVHNQGLELTVFGKVINSKNLKWETSLNFSRNRNKIVSILGPSNDQNKDGKEDDLIANSLFIGQPQNVIYDYEIIGMWQLADRDAGKIPSGFLPGTYKLADLNNDGKISASDDRKILGYTDPSYQIGISNTLQYKKFSLYIFINTIQGGKDYYKANTSFGTNAWGKKDQLIYSTPPAGGWDYWRPENPNAMYRRPDTPSQYDLNTGPIVQRNFIRLQDITLSYSFNKELIKKIDIGNLKVFASGKNLLTFTKWKGWDPETGVGFVPNGLPVMADYTLGINVEF